MALPDMQASLRQAPQHRSRTRPMLGQILASHGEVSAKIIEDALQETERSRVLLGEYLAASNKLSEAALARALAYQSGLPFVDLVTAPPDPSGLFKSNLEPVSEKYDPVAELSLCLREKLCAYDCQMERGQKIYRFAIADPYRCHLVAAQIRQLFCLPRRTRIAFVVARRSQIEAHLQSHYEAQLLKRASARTANFLSARHLSDWRSRALIGGAMGLFICLLLMWPSYMLPILFLGALVMNALGIGLKLASCLQLVWPKWRLTGHVAIADGTAREICVGKDGTTFEAHLPFSARRADACPHFSIIVALHDEQRLVPQLVDALRALQWPAGALEIVFAVESEDQATRVALQACDLPAYMRVLTVPEGWPKTKPRALNYALDFVSGDYVGIYDAEDIPAPDQLEKVAHTFANVADDCAVVQARLAMRNDADGVIARCFAAEYEGWFRVMLPGICRLGFPLPLGGTSVFCKREVLVSLGAWDAHNVTEDADLGMRFARAGYSVRLANSETGEQAVSDVVSWIRQRSRWQKGYLQTWLVHMRSPMQLLADLGMWRFLGFQMLFLGAASAFLAQPLFWGVFGWWLFIEPPMEAFWLDHTIGHFLVLSLFWGQAVSVLVAAIGVLRARRWWVFAIVPLMPVYWLLATLSGAKALIEAVVAPVYWDKTEH